MSTPTLGDWVPLLIEETKQRLCVTELVDVADHVWLGADGMRTLAFHADLLARESGRATGHITPTAYVLEDGSLIVSAMCALGAFGFRVAAGEWRWCQRAPKRADGPCYFCGAKPGEPHTDTCLG